MDKQNILLTFKLTDEPNETELTAIALDGNGFSFTSFNGFEALDIYNLVTKKGENHERS